MTINPPRIELDGTEKAAITVEARPGAWSEVRLLAKTAECRLTEEFVGFITKKFTMVGTEEQLQSFINLAWGNAILGDRFREAIREQT